MPKVPFVPIKGLESEINLIPIQEGNLYISTDSGRIFFDTNNERKVLGGAGISVFFASDDDVEQNLSANTYILHKQKINTTLDIKINDLIINSTGQFFKVLSVRDNSVICSLVAVSGSGGSGGGTGGGTGGVRLNFGQNMYEMPVFLYGASKIITFTPTATGDNTEDQYFNVSWRVIGANDNYIKTGTLTRLKKDIPVEFDLGSQLYEGKNSRITFKVIGTTTQYSYEYNDFTDYYTVNMKVSLASDPITTALIDEQFKTIAVTLEGQTDGQQLKFYLKNKKTQEEFLQKTQIINSYDNPSVAYTYSLENLSSGLYEFKIVYSLGEVAATPLIVPFAYVDTKSITQPLVWFSDTSTTKINQYETIILKYQIYSPTSVDTFIIQQQINNQPAIDVEIDNSESGYFTWYINNYELGDNIFTISYQNVSESIHVFVERSTRNLASVQGAVIDFDPIGRSNYETKLSRATWTYSYATGDNYSASFDHFNWKYNGWMIDNNNTNILRLNNGANMTIPLPAQFTYGVTNTNLNLNELSGATFEFRFKVSNVKNYKPLIQNITQFLIDDGSANGVWKDESLLTENDTIKKNSAGYDILQVVKQINATEDDGFAFYFSDINNIIKGFVLGAEEAFFTSGGQTVNVKYQKDEIINLSIVVGLLNEIDRTSSLKSLKIYLNGVLSGIIKLSNPFKIENNLLKFTSKLCDVDLYKFRVYDRALTMDEIMTNYIADTKNVDIYDQNQIFTSKNNTEINSSQVNYDNTISFKKLQDYNNDPNLPDEKLTMCYGVLSNIEEKVTSGIAVKDRLPVFKGNNVNCTFEFFNPSLDRAIDKGLPFEAAVNKYFPSFKADNVDLNVQGTSSQGYPRRNFKAKFNKAKLIYTKDPAQQVYSKKAIKFKLDSDNTTDKFTWKIDYMDSSSAHNTGLANILNTFYDKHPLDYYNNTNGEELQKYRTAIYGFPMLLFQKHTYNDEREEYEFIGKYNFNLDKSSNSYYGFEDSALNPILHKSYKTISECWEIKNNQGTWTSFKIPTGANLETLKSNTNVLEITDYFEYRKTPEIINPETINGFEKWDDFLDEVYEQGKGHSGEFAEAYSALGAAAIEAQKDVHHNLYELIEWLNSTDTDPSRISNLPFANNEIKTFYIDKPYMKLITSYQQDEESQDDYNDHYEEGLTYYYLTLDPSHKFYLETEATNINAENFDSNKENLYIDYDINRSQNQVIYRTIREDCDKDDLRYRRAKFNAEFDKHLNKEYCIIYYILTELLLMYDSRGKNMMLASWGPQEEGGSYIWFPIFYDLDTQLGLNNSGIPTYNYDTDASEQKAFSTSNSILWNNLRQEFGAEIMAKYISLRENKIKSQAVLENGYNYRSNNDSYVIKGIRPICIHNADEYYKYLAPMTVGYWNTEGELLKDTGEYLYACQGTRESYRKSLLKNRLNYIDSYWQAGPYSAEKSLSSYWMRINGNDSENTSDTGNSMTTIIDASPNFSITPYLNQYLTVGYDKIYTTGEKATASVPKTIQAIDSLANQFNSSEVVSESLVYIPGASFIKSLGDLSNKYISEWHFSSNSDIQDFILGNDADNYKNQLIKNQNQLAGTFTNLPLLEEIVLTGLTSYGEEIDATGCPKLKTFRALRTNIPKINLQEGTIISKLHLPSTVTSLNLNSAIDLTRLIKVRKNNNNEVISYQEFADKEGLYIEGLFDSDINGVETSKLNEIIFENDNLGVQSYEIIKQLIHLNQNTETILNISMKNVRWTPWEVIDIDEELPVKTYKKTNYHTFEEVTNLEEQQQLLEVKALYKKNNIDNYPIDTLDIFIQANENSKIATFDITGEIYIDNDIAISAEELDNLELLYPGLTFFGKTVDRGIEVKFLINPDTGEFKSYYKQPQTNTSTNQRFIEIYKIDIEPKKDHHTFKWWFNSDDSEDFFNGQSIIQYNIGTDDSIILRPHFELESYRYIFYYGVNAEDVEEFEIAYQQKLNTVNIPIPYKDATELLDDPDRGPQRYAFRGYTLEAPTALNSDIHTFEWNDEIPFVIFTISELNDMESEQRTIYYAVFQKEFLFEAEAADDDAYFYFGFNSANNLYPQGSYTIGLIKQLKGKILLPSYHNDLPVTTIVVGDSSTSITNRMYAFNYQIGVDEEDRPILQGENITHIYWYETVDKPCVLTEIKQNAFRNLTNLVYFQFNSRYEQHISNVIIGAQAFYGTNLINRKIYVDTLGRSCLENALKTSSLYLYGIKVVVENAIRGWYNQDDSDNKELFLGNLDRPFEGSPNHFNYLGRATETIKELYWKYNDISKIKNILSQVAFKYKNQADFHIYYIDYYSGEQYEITEEI